MVTANGGLEGDWYKHPRSSGSSPLDRRNAFLAEPPLETFTDEDIQNADGFPIDERDQVIDAIDAQIEKDEESLEDICANSVGIEYVDECARGGQTSHSGKKVSNQLSLREHFYKSLHGLEGEERLTKVRKQISVVKGVQLGLKYHSTARTRYAVSVQKELKKQAPSSELTMLFVSMVDELDAQKLDLSLEYDDLISLRDDVRNGTFFTDTNDFNIFTVAPKTHYSFFDTESAPEIVTSYFDDLLSQPTIGEMARVAITTGMILRNGVYNRAEGKRKEKLMRDKLTGHADWLLQNPDQPRAISLDEGRIYRLFSKGDDDTVGIKLCNMRVVHGNKQRDTYATLGRVVADTQMTLSRAFPDEHYLADALHHHAEILEKVYR